MKLLIYAVFIFLKFYLAVAQEKILPLVMNNDSANSKTLVFQITGDGGWYGFDIKMSEEYKNQHLSYVFLNSYKYFWSTKSPDELTIDIIPVLNKYLKEWNKTELLLVGFSFGAEILPFLYTRLPDELKKKVKLVVLITPNSTSDFTIHFHDMIGIDGDYPYNVVTEVEKIHTTHILAIFGEKEKSIFPETGTQKNLKIKYNKGGHHFTDANAVMKIILKEL